jgi:D-3-phosphoglycerate dehydrogenase
MRVLTTTSSFGKADSAPLDTLRSKCEVILNPYGRKLTTQEFIDLTDGVDGVIAGVEQITRDALAARKNIKVISRCGVGMDNVDQDACREFGIKLFNTPEAPVASVAELTVTITLDLLKNVSNMNTSLKAGNWNKMSGLMLNGKKIGIIGFGRIGKRVAELVKPFGVDVAYTDIEDKHSEYVFMSKSELIKWADIISIHSSFCEEGQFIIGGDELKQMDGAYLINTSRGRFVDEEALYEALKSGTLAGAALDVFQAEPYKGKLIELDNVILTPHIASSAKEGRAVMEMEAVQNLFKGLGLNND